MLEARERMSSYRSESCLSFEGPHGMVTFLFLPETQSIFSGNPA